MIRSSWALLRPFLANPFRRLSALVGLSAAGGVIEAAVLVIVVNTALSVAAGDDAATELPIVGVEVSQRAMMAVAVVLAITLIALHGIVARVSTGIASDVLHRARERAMSGFISASWPAQASSRDGELQETTLTLSRQVSVMALTQANALAAAVGLAPLLVAAVFIDAFVLVIVLVLGVALFSLIRPITRLTNRRAQRLVAANADLHEDISRLGAMAMEARIFGAQGRILNDLDQRNTEVAEQHRSTRFISVFGATMYRDIAILCLVLAVAALTQVGDGRIEAIGAVVLLMVRALAYLSMVNTAIQQISEQSPNVAELERRLIALEGAAEQLGTARVDHLGDLRITDATYAYDGDRPVLSAAVLQVPFGAAVGIIGPSGAGKSTLLQVLMRLRRPTEGSVSAAGQPYEDIHPDDWSRLVTFVPQEPSLMEATIRDNIRFFRDDLSDEQVEQAADLAHVGDEIRRLPHGFDTRLGPRGSGLSGGQKQRVAIARALAGGPELIVLDEPTSALDAVSEASIHDTIRDLKGAVSIVIVAHRETTLELCDRVVDIRDIGGVVAARTDAMVDGT